MVLFFRATSDVYYATVVATMPSPDEIQKLSWLFGQASLHKTQPITGRFVAPRKEMVSPWSTNAVEVVQAMGITGIERIEKFVALPDGCNTYDPMLQQVYQQLDQRLFDTSCIPDAVKEVENIATYSLQEGLALSEEEIGYLETMRVSLGRKLTDSEVFGFSQINSEHCRHKIFNGSFIIDGKKKASTLFQLIRHTAAKNPHYIVSAYQDNVAFIEGPEIAQFAPSHPAHPSYFKVKNIKSVLSLKAETHNFPVTVEPFNGAATGSGGEIRDRLAGGKGSLPLAGTAVYMTAYPRLEGGRPWEKKWQPRSWQYQTPAEILIKASDGASDFGNKFGQPLLCGSLLTFEHFENNKKYSFDKVVMLAGGVGFGKAQDSKKEKMRAGDIVVMMGGDNYRIGMGGSAVSSLATGELESTLEWKAIQRANPEMQKRIMNVIRALTEMTDNPIRSIHDHGAGGHLNCFAELLEETGGTIQIDKLPKGDNTLSDREVLSNESQERMGMVVDEKDIGKLQQIADRERAPLYVVGKVTEDGWLRCINLQKNIAPIALRVSDLFGSSPKTMLYDKTENTTFDPIEYNPSNWLEYLSQVLQLESVACKDWLTNKVDRSVTGKVATQQTCGAVQLPLNNVGVMALDFTSRRGVAMAIGHAPAAALIDPVAGSRLAIAKALTNIVWAPLTHGLTGVSMSANWMWPAKNKGEDAKLYEAVAAASKFAQQLGINIPTGKDSLSMTQKYPNGETIHAPGTVVISAVGEVKNISQTVSPCLANVPESSLLYIYFSQNGFQLGGSSLGQVLNQIGTVVPAVAEAAYFSSAFNLLQQLIVQGLVLAGHDISAGGLITTLLEMCFPSPSTGLSIDVRKMGADTGADTVQLLFGENPGVVIQVSDEKKVTSLLDQQKIKYTALGKVIKERNIQLQSPAGVVHLDIDRYRDTWFKTSFLLDRLQRPAVYAKKRLEKYGKQPLSYSFPPSFDERFSAYHIAPHKRKTAGIKAAVIREKGINGDREMAYSLYLAGFDVKDVHMTDLIAGQETLSDISLIAFAGGFSHSDVFNAAKGWAGSFLHNPKANTALANFYARKDTLSLGVCNGCQLMMELGLIYPDWSNHPVMHHNGSGKFESIFANITIPKNKSVMLKSLEGARLGAWVAHGEGRFKLPKSRSHYEIAAAYTYQEYPGNPNDSSFATAALVSTNGRHLAIMPHIERSIFPWNWAHYPNHRKQDKVSPWIEAFVNAYEWVKEKRC